MREKKEEKKKASCKNFFFGWRGGNGSETKIRFASFSRERRDGGYHFGGRRKRNLGCSWKTDTHFCCLNLQTFLTNFLRLLFK